MGGGNDSNVQRSGTRINKDEQDTNAKERVYVERNDTNLGQPSKDLGHFQTLNLPSKQGQPFFPPLGQAMDGNPSMYNNNMNTFIKDPQSTLEYQCRIQHQQIQQQQYQLQQLQHLQLQLQYQLQLQQQQYQQQLELLHQSSHASEKTEAKRPENGDGNGNGNDSNGNRLGGNSLDEKNANESSIENTNTAVNFEAQKPVNGNERGSSNNGGTAVLTNNNSATDEKRKEPEKMKRRKEASKERKDYRKNVEKKRRAKISSAIDEFRHVLPPGADKVKKALVLELAVDYIKQLKTEYEALLAKNKQLLELNKSLRAKRESIMQSSSSRTESADKSIPHPTANTSLSTGE